MSGSNSSVPASDVRPEAACGLSLTVHSMPDPALDERRTSTGRLKMLLVLLVCAAPVVASYFTYFVVRPQGRTNYSELIEPVRPIPGNLALADLKGQPVDVASLKKQWLLVVVASGACDAGCEKNLWLQRQLKESLGREKERLDKLWLINDASAPPEKILHAVASGVPATVLRASPEALSAWLIPAQGQRLEDHLYIVDPMGHWMMRVPPRPDASRVKRDLEKLMRASAGWDKPGR